MCSGPDMSILKKFVNEVCADDSSLAVRSDKDHVCGAESIHPIFVVCQVLVQSVRSDTMIVSMTFAK